MLSLSLFSRPLAIVVAHRKPATSLIDSSRSVAIVVFEEADWEEAGATGSFPVFRIRDKSISGVEVNGRSSE
jgi:hypothetical protein